MDKVFYVCSCHRMASDVNQAIELIGNQLCNELGFENKDNLALSSVLSGNNLIVVAIDGNGHMYKRTAYAMEYAPTYDCSFINVAKFELEPYEEDKEFDYEDEDEDEEDEDEEDEE